MSFYFLLEVIYFILPAYFANMGASLSSKIRILDFLKKPIDFDKKTSRNVPIFGKHKTWRGLIFGVLIGVFVAYCQKLLYQIDFFKYISIIDYGATNIFLWGILLSCGAIMGDLISAFFKRRQNIKPGLPWIPFDQINLVVGAFILTGPFAQIEIYYWGLLLGLTFFLHILGNNLAYLLGIQKNKW